MCCSWPIVIIICLCRIDDVWVLGMLYAMWATSIVFAVSFRMPNDNNNFDIGSFYQFSLCVLLCTSTSTISIRAKPSVHTYTMHDNNKMFAFAYNMCHCFLWSHTENEYAVLIRTRYTGHTHSHGKIVLLLNWYLSKIVLIECHWNKSWTYYGIHKKRRKIICSNNRNNNTNRPTLDTSTVFRHFHSHKCDFWFPFIQINFEFPFICFIYATIENWLLHFGWSVILLAIFRFMCVESLVLALLFYLKWAPPFISMT